MAQRRPVKPPPERSIMPPDLAAGPGDGQAGMHVWLNACTRWSAEHGHGWNGWKVLLPPSVRAVHLPSALERHRRLCEGQ